MNWQLDDICGKCEKPRWAHKKDLLCDEVVNAQTCLDQFVAALGSNTLQHGDIIRFAESYADQCREQDAYRIAAKIHEVIEHAIDGDDLELITVKLLKFIILRVSGSKTVLSRTKGEV